MWNVVVNRLQNYRLWDIEGRNIEKTAESAKNLYFKVRRIGNSSTESSDSKNFIKEINKIFQIHLNILSKLWLSFCCHQQSIQKISYFNIFMTINLGVNVITREITLFFHLLVKLSPLVYFISCILRVLLIQKSLQFSVYNMFCS